MFPQEAGQLHTIIPVQLNVQQQELIGVRVRGQPLHQRRGGVEYLHVIVPSLGTSFSLQHMTGGCFILLRGARVIFANGDAVHELTSGYVDFHRHYTMPVSP